jgi:hypothetical protein
MATITDSKLDIEHVNKIMKEEVADQFNSLVGQFQRKLIGTYPDSATPLKGLYAKILMAFAADKTIVVNKFSVFIQPYKAHIQTKSDEFFDKHASSIPLFDGIDMKSNWSATPPETKRAIWSYMTALLELSESYVNCDFAFTGSTGGLDIKKVMQTTQSVLSDFQKTHDRAPSTDDELSEYSLSVAKKLGLDLSSLDRINLREVEKSISKPEFMQSLGLTKKMKKPQIKGLIAFVVKQLRAVQKKQKLKARLLELKRK